MGAEVMLSFHITYLLVRYILFHSHTPVKECVIYTFPLLFTGGSSAWGLRSAAQSDFSRCDYRAAQMKHTADTEVRARAVV